MRLVIASNNQDKINEYSQMFKSLGIEIVSLKGLGLDIEVEEDGETFEENAIKKAKEICKICGEVSLADDSGLCVDSLNGAPGVYSARYSGENASYSNNNKKLLEELKGVPKEERTAHFVCVIAVVFPDGRTILSRGETEGLILEELQGEGGFGYDPIFYYPPFNKTFAEVSKEEKNSVSHRGRALEKLKEELKQILK